MVEVEITNLTNATYFTPLLVAAHGLRFHLFQVGDAASEVYGPWPRAVTWRPDRGGGRRGGSYVENPAGGLLAPGAHVGSKAGDRADTPAICR